MKASNDVVVGIPPELQPQPQQPQPLAVHPELQPHPKSQSAIQLFAICQSEPQPPHGFVHELQLEHGEEQEQQGLSAGFEHGH